MNSLPNISFRRTDKQSLPIEIIAMGDFYQRYTSEPLKSLAQASPFEPHRTRFYNLLVIEEGENNHFIDGHDYPLKAGHILLIRPQQVHAFLVPSRPLKGHLIIFTDQVWETTQGSIGADFSRLFNWSSRFHNPHSLNKNDQQQALSILAILQQNQNQASSDNTLQTLLLMSLLRVLTRYWPDPPRAKNERSMDLLLSFNDALSHQLTKSRDAKTYASQLRVSYKTLNKVCKETLNLTAKQVIDNAVIIEAKRMLLTEKQATQTVAYALGFDESTNFVKFFKRHTGKTPQAYR